MRTYRANESCQYGLYFSLRGLDMRFVGGDGESLMGKRGVTYYRLPNTLLVLASPLIGGLFVLSFPLIILGMTSVLATYALAKMVWSFAAPKAYLTSLRWEPTLAYLAKPKGEKAKGEDEKTDENASDASKKS